MFDFPREKSNIPLLINYIEEVCGISLGLDKDYLIYARLGHLISKSRVPSIPALLSLARADHSGQLRSEIIDAMTTNETLWFRGDRPWESLTNVLFPTYGHLLASGKRRRIRILCAACSTGQEPYSLAMLLADAASKGSIYGLGPAAIEITAIDISQAAIAQAKSGEFNAVEMGRGLPEHFRTKYFVKQKKSLDWMNEKFSDWTIDEKIRSMVHFRQFNLQQDLSPLGAFDLVLCRNVLIYFREEFKQTLIERLAHALVPHGHLLLGGSESLFTHQHLFEQEEIGPAIFYRRLAPPLLDI